MIIVVENDVVLARQLMQGLQALKQPVLTAPSLVKARVLLANHVPEVIVLDRVLDDGDGLELLEDILDQDLPTRTIVLSELGSTPEKIHGLGFGADDYLPKPFSFQELLLRVKKLLYKRRELPTTELILGPLTIKPETGEFFYKNNSFRLRKREMEIFACLVRRKNQVVTRDKIIDLVWSGESEPPTYSTLDVYIRRIRMALSNQSYLLETVRGFGYRAIEQSVF